MNHVTFDIHVTQAMGDSYGCKGIIYGEMDEMD